MANNHCHWAKSGVLGVDGTRNSFKRCCQGTRWVKEPWQGSAPARRPLTEGSSMVPASEWAKTHTAAQVGNKRQAGSKCRWVLLLPPGNQDTSSHFSLYSLFAAWMRISEAHLLLDSRTGDSWRGRLETCSWGCWMWCGSLGSSGWQMPGTGEQCMVCPVC